MLKNIDDIISYLKSNSYFNVLFHNPNVIGLERLQAKYILPSSYKKFLTMTDGMQFFHSGDESFYCIDYVIEFNKYKEFKKNVYLIGYFLDNDIVIDSSNCNNYLYAGDVNSLDEYILLGNLENFLINLIANKGDIYWDFTNKELYDFSIPLL